MRLLILALATLFVLIDLKCPESSTVETDAPERDRNILNECFLRADMVFLATVVSVGTPPPAWSGIFPAYQEVRYAPRACLQGAASGRPSRVCRVSSRRCPIAHGRRNRAQAAAVPRAPGAQVVLFLRLVGARLEGLDENSGIVAADPPTLALLDSDLRSSVS